jgi:peptidoglycan hydrolase-like protein with peptidoglycan-binding domain
MRRPSPAIVIATAALFVALSGTAYAATGGTFILGKPNTAASVSSLSNSAGTALSLSSKAGTPPLTVGSTSQVPKLNASLLGGLPASSFVQGRGGYQTGTLTLNNQSNGFIAGNYPTDSLYLDGYCDPTGLGSGVEIRLYNSTGVDAQVTGLFDGTFGSRVAASGSYADLTSSNSSPHFVVAQVIAGSQLITIVLTATFNPFATNPGPDQCTYAVQLFDS